VEELSGELERRVPGVEHAPDAVWGLGHVLRGELEDRAGFELHSPDSLLQRCLGARSAAAFVARCEASGMARFRAGMLGLFEEASG